MDDKSTRIGPARTVFATQESTCGVENFCHWRRGSVLRSTRLLGRRQFQKRLLSDDPWEKLLLEQEFRGAIDENGYYQYPISFPDYKKKYHLALTRQTPSYLSIDFWSDQSPTLRNEKLYVIRTGKGRFAIFNEDRFAKPYLDLRIDNTKELVTKDISGFRHLKSAFKDHHQEDVNLEHLRLNGVYNQLVSAVCRTDQYQIGPRGGRTSSFKIYFNDKENPDRPVILDYQGQEELDYTIWTEDSVLVFEAKQRGTGGLDIGWHKLALPCYRFRNYNGLKVIPVYYLRRGDVAYLIVFRPINFQKYGILLNDVAGFNQYMVFRVNLWS